MFSEMKGKIVAITGGAAGIGRAMALEFAAAGADLAVCGRRNEKLLALAEEVKPFGVRIYHQVADVSKIDQIENFVQGIVSNLGGLDVWINNAGIDTPGLVGWQDVTETLWDEMMDIDLKAVFFGSQFAARRMLEKGGVILNISSFASLIPTAGRSVYACAKAAMNNLTKTLAAEMAPYNIRVVSLIPGYIKTEMTAEGVSTRFKELVSAIPAGRLGEVEDLTKMAVFLCTQGAAYISGVNIEISGGKFAVQNPLWGWQQKEEKENKSG